MERTPWAIAIAVFVALVGAGCAAPGGTINPSPPATCPDHGPGAVVFAGDSLATVWPRYLTLPAGAVTIGAARAGAGFTKPPTGDPTTSFSISERLFEQLDACGDDVGLVVVSGGANDLSAGQPVEPLLDAIAELDAQLASRGVAVVWLPITPWAVSSTAPYDLRYDRRLVANEFISTPGDLTGSVVDCNEVLRVSGVTPEMLRDGYWTWADAITPDRFHLNDAGYQAYAGCLSPLLSALVPAL